MSVKPYTGPAIVIVGPTASGKTGVAIDIVKELLGGRSASLADALLRFAHASQGANTRRTFSTSRSVAPASSQLIPPKSSLICGAEIISADSRAIYKGMDIGTAKPSMLERQGIVHWGFDLVEPGERFTVADWKEYAEQKICSIRAEGKVPIVCGGTGLYVDALIYNYQFSEHKNCSKEEGSEQDFAEKYPDRIKMQEEFLVFGILWERDKLRKRITERVNKLFVQELFEETRKLVEKYGWESQAMKSNIYQFAWGYMTGKYTLEEAKRLNALDDWHLAKRQMTWFKRNPEIKWLPLGEIRRAALETIELYIVK